MFPTLGHLLSYLTGQRVVLPVPTFGLFMLLSFAGAWVAFQSEYKRKEAGGGILMDRLLLYCGISGFAGAILSAKLERLTGFSVSPFHWLFSFNGLNYYGALLAGATTYLVINRRHGIPLSVAVDIGSPGMMLAYGIGRIGCHLSGDGDWGIVNVAARPGWLQWAPDWIWQFRYPHNSIHQGVAIPGCMDSYCTQLAAPVYPTSFYEAVICLLLFAFLWWLRRKPLPAGLLFFVYALLSGAERFTIEFIRINPRYSLWGWHLSQAQVIALGSMALGVIGIFVLLRRNMSTILTW